MKTIVFISCLITAILAQQNPTISFISKEKIVNIGDSVELHCQVQYQSQYSVQWVKLEPDHQFISSGSSLIVPKERYVLNYNEGTNSYVLTINKLQEIDAGRYQCQIVLGPTSRIPADVYVHIRIPPVIADNSTRSIITSEGNLVELHCYAGGYPLPRISWRREGNELLPNGAAMFIGNVLKILRITKEDRGTYYCVADNGVGKGARRNIGVEVEFSPVVSVERPRYGQALQYDMDIQCRIEAFPSPSIQWWFAGEHLQNNQHQQISIFPTADEFTETNLQVITIEKRQYGNYTCKAINKLGHSEKTILLFETVNVICPPACDVDYIRSRASARYWLSIPITILITLGLPYITASVLYF